MVFNARSFTILGMLAGLAGGCLLLPQTVLADPLQQTVQQGKKLFMGATFNGNGRHCNTCHRGGGTEIGRLPNGESIPSLNNAASIFPRFNKRAGKVITLQDQVHHCIQGGLQGVAPPFDSGDMVAIVSYLTSLSQGKSIDMGGKPE